MLFSNQVGNMSIRQLIQSALADSMDLNKLQGDEFYKKCEDLLNQDGQFESDYFRKPVLDALMRGDYTAAQSLIQLSLLHVSWAGIKDRDSGKVVVSEIKKQLDIDIADADTIIPVAMNNIRDFPNLSRALTSLVKDKWIQSLGSVMVGHMKFVVYQVANKPIKKNFHQMVESAFADKISQ